MNTRVNGLLALIVGALTAVQSRLNGQLSKEIHNGIAAAVISFITGWILLWILCFGIKREREGLKALYKGYRTGRLGWWELIGGMGGGFFVATQSGTVPVIGVAIFTIATVGGQTVASLVVDKLGISPSGKKQITIPRVFAAVMTLFAVSVAVYPQLANAHLAPLPVILSVIVGIIVSFQQALNARVNVVTQRPLATAFLNFLMGFIVLIIALTVNLANGGEIGPMPHNFWLYTGGSIGLIFIATSAHVVRSLGVLNFVLFSVTGQLTGALLLDWLAPAAKTTVSANLIFGTIITLGSIAISRYFDQGSTAPRSKPAK